MLNFLANWSAPSNIFALTTTRVNGHSLPPFDRNNLGLHVGDNEQNVRANRQALKDTLMLPGEPIWLEQTHSNLCITVEKDVNRVADAAVTRVKHHPLVIMTADCLPILLCNEKGTEIAAIHAGWRGLVNGIVENTLMKMDSAPETIMAWIGPAICSSCFEIGEEVRHAYTSHYPFTAGAFIMQEKKMYGDLPKMAALILNANGVNDVSQSGACTFEMKNKFYSYRREANTGRMATLIWFDGC